MGRGGNEEIGGNGEKIFENSETKPKNFKIFIYLFFFQSNITKAKNFEEKISKILQRIPKFLSSMFYL